MTPMIPKKIQSAWPYKQSQKQHPVFRGKVVRATKQAHRIKMHSNNTRHVKVNLDPKSKQANKRCLSRTASKQHKLKDQYAGPLQNCNNTYTDKTSRSTNG
ncbi:unnamed protein product, partial [Trichogramma brassicae]